MADEPKIVEVTLGPYAGQRLSMPTVDADAAIADGWARDPSEPVDPNAEPKQVSDEDRQKALEAANKAARKLRGEEEAEKKPGEHKTEVENRQMKPADEDHSGQDYTTRSGRPPRRT